MNYLHLFLCLLLLGSGFLMCNSINPVESVLFLILAFCNAAAILFLFNSEFLGLIFIIIYVGAIAVLFLFVIMMLNIKNKNNFEENNVWVKYLLSFSFFYLIVTSLFFFIRRTFCRDDLLLDTQSSDVFILIDNLNNIDVLGQVLFNYFLICFLLAGLILLIALVGSIVLTLRFNNTEEGQLVNRQLSRTDNFLSFFK
jgi:NADH-quinone oxidoreductase subunit J